LPPDSGQPQNIATAVAEISERATLLIREEIELAKAEVSEKISRLIKGLIVGSIAGIFIGTALLFLLHGLAWLTWFELFGPGEIFWGYLIVAAVLLILGGIAGYLAAKAVRSSAPPKPEMAIDEARRIRDTVTGDAPPEPESTFGRPI